MVVKPPDKRPMTAKTFRALLFSLSPSERITFGKIVVEHLIDQKDGVYDLIRILVLNLSDEETSVVNSQIRRVKELFSDTSPGEAKAQLTPPPQPRIESEDFDEG